MTTTPLAPLEEYLALTCTLAGLQDAEAGDPSGPAGKAADEVRDRSEGSWYALTQEERGWLNTFTAYLPSETAGLLGTTDEWGWLTAGGGAPVWGALALENRGQTVPYCPHDKEPDWCLQCLRCEAAVLRQQLAAAVERCEAWEALASARQKLRALDAYWVDSQSEKAVKLRAEIADLKHWLGEDRRR